MGLPYDHAELVREIADGILGFFGPESAGIRCEANKKETSGSMSQWIGKISGKS